VGETRVLVQQRLHRRRVPTLYRAVQLLDLRHGWLLLAGKSTAKILALPALGSTTGLATQVMPLHVWIAEKPPPGALEAISSQLEDERAMRDLEGALRVLLDHQHSRAFSVDRLDRVEHRVHHA